MLSVPVSVLPGVRTSLFRQAFGFVAAFCFAFDGSLAFHYCLHPMKRLLTSCFGLGWLPVAPGTWGFLPRVTLLRLLGHLGVESVGVRLVMGTVVLWAGVVCVSLASAAIALTGRKDPGEVVMDEVAGQALAFCAVPGAFWSHAASVQV